MIKAIIRIRKNNKKIKIANIWRVQFHNWLTLDFTSVKLSLKRCSIQNKTWTSRQKLLSRQSKVLLKASSKLGKIPMTDQLLNCKSNFWINLNMILQEILHYIRKTITGSSNQLSLISTLLRNNWIPIFPYRKFIRIRS